MSSWNGTRVRKGERLGKVIDDWNSRWRILTVRMDDGSREEIMMNNIGDDPEDIHDWEWLRVGIEGMPEQKWHRF